MPDREAERRSRAGHVTVRAATAILASAALIGAALPAFALAAGSNAKRRASAAGKLTGSKNSRGARPAAGALYVGDPFTGDRFELRIMPGARDAKFVGRFVYSDPGCPTAPFGNEYLTPENAPTIKIAEDGRFSGHRKNGAYLEKISGTFEGTKAPTMFVETIPGCAGDKPQSFSFTMHTSAPRTQTKPDASVGATPRAGCWGTCGGDEGPVGGFFFVPADHKQVQEFGYEDKCLGIRSIPQPVGPPARVGYGLELPNMTVSGGRFNFKGTGEAYANSSKPTHVRLVLTGTFKTPKEAIVMLHVSHHGCSATRLTIKAD